MEELELVETLEGYNEFYQICQVEGRKESKKASTFRDVSILLVSEDWLQELHSKERVEKRRWRSAHTSVEFLVKEFVLHCLGEWGGSEYFLSGLHYFWRIKHSAKHIIGGWRAQILVLDCPDSNFSFSTY